MSINKSIDFSDAVFVRIFLLLIAVFFLCISGWIIFFTQSIELWGAIIIAVLMLFGFYFLFVGLFATNNYARTIAKKTGNHELLILVVVIAGLISSAIKK